VHNSQVNLELNRTTQTLRAETWKRCRADPMAAAAGGDRSGPGRWCRHGCARGGCPQSSYGV